MAWTGTGKTDKIKIREEVLPAIENQNDFSIGTAAGIFKSLVSIILIVIANQIAKRNGEERLF